MKVGQPRTCHTDRALESKEELAMRKVIMIGCDLHDKTMLLKIADHIVRDRQRARAGRVRFVAG